MIWRAPRLRAAALFALVLAASLAPAAFGWPAWKIVAGLVLCILAALIAVEDLAAMTIPDWGVGAMALVALAVQLGEGASMRDAAWALALGVVTAAALFLSTWAYGWLRGTDVLGFGDVKLVGASAVLVGPWGVAMQLMLASLAAILFAAIRAWRKGRRLRAATRLPFGTFLAPAAIIVWAWLPPP